MEELDEKVWTGLILGYQSSHLRVDGLPQSLEQWEVAACICRFKSGQHEIQVDMSIISFTCLKNQKKKSAFQFRGFLG